MQSRPIFANWPKLSQLCFRRRRDSGAASDAGSDFAAWNARIAAAQNRSLAGAAVGGRNGTANSTAAMAAAGANVMAQIEESSRTQRSMPPLPRPTHPGNLAQPFSFSPSLQSRPIFANWPKLSQTCFRRRWDSLAGAAVGGLNGTADSTAAIAAAGATVVAQNGVTGTLSSSLGSGDNPQEGSKGGYIAWAPPPSMGGWNGLVTPKQVLACHPLIAVHELRRAQARKCTLRGRQSAILQHSTLSDISISNDLLPFYLSHSVPSISISIYISKSLSSRPAAPTSP